jgi:hypothetical protein
VPIAGVHVREHRRSSEKLIGMWNLLRMLVVFVTRGVRFGIRANKWTYEQVGLDERHIIRGRFRNDGRRFRFRRDAAA